MSIITVGVALAKSVFSIQGVGAVDEAARLTQIIIFQGIRPETELGTRTG